MTLAITNLECYRTNAQIPLAMLIPGLEAGKLRLGQKPGQVCISQGPTDIIDAKAQGERREYARKMNQAILESSDVGNRLLSAWNLAKKAGKPADGAKVLAAAIAGKPTDPPVTVAPGTPKPQRKAAANAKKSASVPAVFSLTGEAPEPEPATPIATATAKHAAANPGYASPIVLDEATCIALADLANVVKGLRKPVTLDIGAYTFQVTP